MLKQLKKIVLLSEAERSLFYLSMKHPYKNKQWQNKRKYILKKYHHLDQELIRYGKHVEADTVHHIFPVEFYPELKYVDWNLIPLSRETHNEMHDRHKNEHFNLTPKGLELQKRHKRQYQRWCRENGYKPHYEN